MGSGDNGGCQGSVYSIHLQLTEDERVRVSSTPVHSTEIEVSPYTVTYTDYESTDGGPTGPVTFQLPILYATWPIDKALPEGMEYVVENEIHIPEPLITRAAPGDPIINLNYPLTGRILDYDDELSINIPLAQLTIGVAGYNCEPFTTTLGDFSFMVSLPYFPLHPMAVSATVTVTFLNSGGAWKITGNSTTAPITRTLTATFRTDASGNPIPTQIVIPEDNSQLGEIHRAAHYFYATQNELPKTGLSSGIRIVANPQPDPEYPDARGNFAYSSSNTSRDPYINIYNHGLSDSKVVGTTIHELGHSVHFLNNRSAYTDVPDLLHESFASYSGWYLGEQYYETLGWEKPSGLLTVGMRQPSSDEVDITGQARQDWDETMLSWYSPLFIDLTDGINQNAYFTNARNYLSENVQNVPPSVVWNIISTCTTWGQVRTKMEQTLVPRYCTSTQLDDYLEEYNYWFFVNTGSISR